MVRLGRVCCPRLPPLNSPADAERAGPPGAAYPRRCGVRPQRSGSAQVRDEEALSPAPQPGCASSRGRGHSRGRVGVGVGGSSTWVQTEGSGDSGALEWGRTGVPPFQLGLGINTAGRLRM